MDAPASTGTPANTFVADGVGYFAAGWDGLYVFDVTNPAAPALLGHWISPDWVIDLVVVEGIAYATLGDTGVAAVDLTEPANPRLLGLVTVPGFAGSIDVAPAMRSSAGTVRVGRSAGSPSST